MFQKMLQIGSGGSGLELKYYTSLEKTSDINKLKLTTEKPIKALIGFWNYDSNLTAFYYDQNVKKDKWYRRTNGETEFSEKVFNSSDYEPQGLYNISDDKKTITFQTYNHVKQESCLIMTLE